jgi:nicotinic acid mononucleotide adenylyltransferase
VHDSTGDESSQISVTGEPRIFVTDAVMHDVSATEVRAAVRENRAEDLEGLVPLEVADYIRKYKLYRNTHEA